jgi:hypothetical protein
LEVVERVRRMGRRMRVRGRIQGDSGGMRAGIDILEVCDVLGWKRSRVEDLAEEAVVRELTSRISRLFRRIFLS